ncbi:uncharacterized protein LOC131318694 isoform X1 [Rhododendron vialii]|uniref:uncharacterized protein LOC131318694 isoform X1 n=1 Tax=Rhododendron vialii TaxID=182163 RepID=UPI00265DDC76|nr:uncharacterized protein LOC131318694 isoform X1 [Rhododendron vialii]
MPAMGYGDDSEVVGEELSKLSHEVKLKELLRNLNSAEIKLCSNASKDFVKLLRGRAGGELLRLYVQNSSKLTELDQAWNLQLGKPGLSYVLKVISAILCHPDGVYNSNDTGGVGISRALDKFARSIIEEKLGELYKELNSKEAKRQNAALLLLASVVRRGSGLASDVAKSFDFKLPIFPKLAEYKVKRIGATRKHSTRQAFVGLAMSFLEVGKPGLLRWVLQQKEMYSGVLRGIGSDDDETVVYVLSTLRDMILIPESLVPPSLRSVLFGSVTLEQLVNISGREDGGVAAELAHRVLVIACTDPSNGLMPDLNRQPNPLKGNLKRLLDLMKKLKATEVDYHRDLLLAIVKGRPLFGSAFMDEFPYNVEDHASPNWFFAVSLAANLVSSVGSGLSFDFKPEDPPSFSNPDVQSLIKCICPRPFTRAIVNKGLLHTNSLMKHGILRLVLEELKLLDSLTTTIESNYCSSNHMRSKWLSLKQDIQNEVRILLPDTQVLLSLLSSLSTHSKSLESSLKRTGDSEISLEQGVRAFKRFKTDSHMDDVDILVSGVCNLPEITLQRDTGVVQGMNDVDDVNDGDDNAFVIADIWGLRQCSEGGVTVKDEETHFYSRLLDAFKIYHRTMPAALEGSFDFFRFLPSNPLALPTILQQSLLSLLLELIEWSPKCKIPVRIPPLMYKHLQPFVKLLLYSPSRDIKDQAHILAQAAMLSTGAFDKNLREIGAWFLFLPGYKTGNIVVGDRGIEVFQNLFSVIVSFLCDAVSTVGNNLLKYWDVLRRHTCHLKGVEDVSPEFGPLFICILEKCLRVVSSESGTFTVPEKSMIALYACNTIKYLLQTQGETGLLCSLVDLLLSERVEVEDCFSLDDGDAQDLCEWRPLKNLFLFSRNIQNPQKKCSISRVERKVVHSNSSFADILGEVKRVLRSGSDIELICISKAFVLSILSTPPAVILQHFPSVISASKNLSGFPFSVLLSIFFLEPSLLFEVSKLWPEMFCNGLESFVDMVHGKEPIIGDIDIDAIESSSAAFCLFLKQAPFYVLFPSTVRIDGLCLLEGSNLQYLLQDKFSEMATDDFVSSVLLVLFWFHQIRLSHGIKPLAKFEQISGTCSILIEKMLGFLQDSPTKSIFELTEVIISHPSVMLSLQYPLGHKEFPEGIFGESSENFFVLARQGIHKMDHHVLNLLASVCKCLVTCCNGQNSVSGVDYLKKRFRSSFKALVKKLNRIFRDRFDECIKTGDLKPLTPTLCALHSLIPFISPLELLKLVLWIFSKIDLGDSTFRVSSDFSALLVGLSIAGCAFDMLSAYLQQPNTQGISSNIFWEMEEKPFDILLFESIYFQLIKFAMRFELDAADLCLLKAVNVTNKRKVMHTHWFPLTMDLSRVIHNTPIEVLSHFIRKTSMTRAKMLFLLTELSPVHLSVFGHFFSDVMNEYLLPNDNVTDGTCSNTFSDDNFVMLLPTALSYLISASMKYGEQFHKCVRSMSSFYSRILFRSFSDWKSYVTMDIFNKECVEFLPPSMEELLNLLSRSLLGKSICMLRYYFAFNGDAVKLKKRLKLFNSICPYSGAANEDLLDCDVKEIDAYSLDQSLNLVNRVVAKIYLCRMLLLPKSNQIRSSPKEDGNNTKEIYSEVGSNKEYSSRVRFMNILVHTWHIIVRKFPSNSDDPEKLTGKNYVFRFLEVFISRNILELTREIRNCPFIEQLARLSLFHRFGDPSTLKMLRGVLPSLSDGNSHILVLQLLLAHSQFAPSIHSCFQSSGGSQFGMIFRPMASILRLLVVPSTDESALYGETRQQKTSEMYMKQLEVVRLLRALFCIQAQQRSFDFEKDTNANPRELLFLLLSSYGATLSEVDLEIYSLMLEIESANVSNSGSIAEMDYLWGSAAIRIRKEREQEQDLSSHMMKDVEAVEGRRTRFRENLPIDPKLCAYTVLHFPHGRNVVEVQHGDSDDMNEINYPNVEQIQTYDPVFILRFSIHSLLMGYIEPVEFASLGLLAIAFVSISSPHDEMRKLGYEVLGGFKNALEKCQKRKDLMRLRLLLTYLQNGIEKPWQRIPSITAKFVAEASVILLDPSHDHYSTISKFLMGSARVNMKSVPLFANFLWSSSVNFRTDRLWMLRLLYAGLDSDDDAQIYIRNNILEILLGFYASPFSDIESKELILQVVKKSVEVRKLARHLVEHCSIISWLSSIVSVFCGKQYQAQTNLPFALLNRALEVVNDVISTQNVIEWLQQFALEQLSELSTHLYKLLVGGNLIEKVHLVTSVLEILTLTLKISQERKVYQPHFTLSVEGLYQIYKVVDVCRDGNYSPCAELGLEAILMSTPPGAILCMEGDKLLMFVRWATSTALQSSSAKALQPRDAYCDSAILLETEQSEDSLISKLLRWLTASVILGRLSLRSVDLELNFAPEKSNLETLQSLLKLNKNGCGENKCGFGCEEMLAASIFGLQQLLGMDCRLLPSVVSALSLLLRSDLLHLAGSEMNDLLGNENTVASLWLRVRCPVEANPSWRWSFCQPWKDLSSKSTDSETMDELHACQSLLVIISNVIGKKSLHSQFLSHQDLENCGLFNWERSILESQ